MTRIRYRSVHVNLHRFVEPMALPMAMNACCALPTGKLIRPILFFFFFCEFGVFQS